MQTSLPPPRHTVFRDPSKVDSASLERTVNLLGSTVTRIRQRGRILSPLLLDGIAECERELIDREIRRGAELEQAAVA